MPIPDTTRSQFSLRHCLTPFNPDILQGPEVMIANAREAFDENGRLTNQRSVDGLTNLMAALRQRVEAVRCQVSPTVFPAASGSASQARAASLASGPNTRNS